MNAKRLERLIGLLFDGNQSEAARALGYDDRTVRRWLSEELPVPIVVAMLLETMAARGISAKAVRSYAGLAA